MRNILLLSLGVPTLTAIATVIIWMNRAPNNTSGAQVGTKEFVAATNWIESNDAQYCDMSAEQTLLHVAKKEVKGKFTEAEALEKAAAAATQLTTADTAYGRGVGRYLQTLLGRRTAYAETAVLISLALETKDPVVLNYALQICADPQTPACDAITPYHWATMEPDNGMAWLAVASSAMSNGNESGATNAFNNASRASKFKTYSATSNIIVEAFSIRSLPGYNREIVMRALLPFDRPAPTHVMSLVQYCIQNGSPRLDRSDVCIGIAKKLAINDFTVEGTATVHTIAKHFPWDERQRGYLAEREASAANFRRRNSVQDWDFQFGCLNGKSKGTAAARLRGDVKK